MYWGSEARIGCNLYSQQQFNIDQLNLNVLYLQLYLQLLTPNLPSKSSPNLRYISIDTSSHQQTIHVISHVRLSVLLVGLHHPLHFDFGKSKKKEKKGKEKITSLRKY